MFASPNVFIYDVCYCVTAGSCFNNVTFTNKNNMTTRQPIENSDGTIHERINRIQNFGKDNNSVPYAFNPYVMPASTGAKLVVKNMTSCENGLELCCPSTGFGCGIRYPPVSFAPKPNTTNQCTYGAYPWQTAILNQYDDYIGAGVLIHNRYVLTVAHKVYKAYNVKCRFGEWNFLDTFEAFPIQDVYVDDNDIILHPNFTSLYTLKNDIAILRLNYPGIELGVYPTISPACIPNQQLFDQKCWVAGWGQYNFSSTEFTWVMNEVSLPLVNHSKCQDILRTTRLGVNFNLDENSFICAGGEIGKDACTGDGGAPLTCFMNGRFYLQGLVAWGIGCGTNVPGVYVNVQNFLPWIQETIKSKEQNSRDKYYNAFKTTAQFPFLPFRSFGSCWPFQCASTPLSYSTNDTVVKSPQSTVVVRPNGDVVVDMFGIRTQQSGDSIRNFFRNSAPNFVQVGPRQPEYFPTNRPTVINNSGSNQVIATTQIPYQPSVSTIQKNCGRSKFSSPFIIGGEEAQKGEWPFFGSLFVSLGETNKNLKLICGVSLLSSKHVVTAAHCIELPNEPHRYTVMLGRHNIADPRETNYQSRQITRLAIHPEYKNRQQRADADIAILKLKQAVQFNDFVQTVCLPQNSIDYNNIKGVVVGYGKSESYLEHTTIPRKISVNAANLVTCLYSDPAYVQIASKRNFCAAGSGKSPCKGDSGGGFYVKDSSTAQWILYGLVSEGLIVNGSCDVNKFVVFVDITKFLSWIFQTLQDLATDPCDPFPCGKNSNCFVFADSHFCACFDGLKGDPNKECFR
ncbi:hypothetical protein PVAND_017115 [Polypedilum vanderplanki]|uniref:Peptidase S1 domain-containing protein n=1 Tax=Polypedilum vanderplanki TaxID=319348 RepID=A0A9J6BI37_POLVA|nr:hypothetical protein PVAND_017115 [Polypedilum vanderplanki]